MAAIQTSFLYKLNIVSSTFHDCFGRRTNVVNFPPIFRQSRLNQGQISAWIGATSNKDRNMLFLPAHRPIQGTQAQPRRSRGLQAPDRQQAYATQSPTRRKPMRKQGPFASQATTTNPRFVPLQAPPEPLRRLTHLLRARASGGHRSGHGRRIRHHAWRAHAEQRKLFFTRVARANETCSCVAGGLCLLGGRRPRSPDPDRAAAYGGQRRTPAAPTPSDLEAAGVRHGAPRRRLVY